MIPANPTGASATTPAIRRPFRDTWRGTALNVCVMTVATGLVATLALPGYAIDPVANADALDAATAQAQVRAAEAQEVDNEATTAQTVVRDAFTATTVEELEAARAAEAAAAAAAAAAERRAQLAAAPAAAAYSGPTVGDYIANPAYPTFDLASIAAVGQQYIGTPYRFGGADPSGFDCSGFVQFVYAQFGVALPHSVVGQDAMGTRIAREAAVPGDLVIMPGHNGIYMGNGMIMDAPKPGAFVSVRPIWTDNYWIVRIGI
ncbi:C40 family peptidase [Microcella daejeonensis]|uniref:C40 family peptidase n=1 Tax=Microcella daejeonensis TaxID=2994971 RepID=A0A9E8MIV7_9MICO|nr:C40 family peptidase [Microcella daejeonensis]WAB80379.1 C40 family peptidase [Microcella daejeonensis]